MKPTRPPALRRKLFAAFTLLVVAICNQGCQIFQNEFWVY